MESKVDTYISNCSEIIYTKTHDRSIIGQINDFLIDISWEIEKHILSDNLNLLELNRWTGNLMCGKLRYADPIDLD